MAAGLQIFDALAQATVTLSDRIGRMIGQTSTGTSSGSIVHADFETGEPWAMAVIKSANSSDIELTFTADSVAWTAPSHDHLIIYGVY